MKKIFLYLDDDAFHPESLRNPEVYYPLIGAEHLLDLLIDYELIKVVSVEKAWDVINHRGCPDFISFDNDLMVALEGIDLAKGLVEKDLESPGFIPKDFQFFVHSQNPIAKKRIYSYLGDYLAQRGEMDDNSIKSSPTFR